MELHRLRLPGKTLQNYTRLLVTFILKTNVFKRISNCINVWTLFGVILNTGFDVFWYLLCGLTYRVFFWGVTIDCSCTPDLHEIPFDFFLNLLWNFMSFFCIFTKFLMQFLCSSYAVLTISYTFAKTSYTLAQSVKRFENCIRIS